MISGLLYFCCFDKCLQLTQLANQKAGRILLSLSKMTLKESTIRHHYEWPKENDGIECLGWTVFANQIPHVFKHMLGLQGLMIVSNQRFVHFFICLSGLKELWDKSVQLFCWQRPRTAKCTQKLEQNEPFLAHFLRLPHMSYLCVYC